MKRQDILDSMPEISGDAINADALHDALEKWMVDVLDHYEMKFKEIRDKLYVNCIDDLGGIIDAVDIAFECARDLY